MHILHLLAEYSVIMLDDFHERSTQLDLLLSLLVTRIMPKRPKLRLIISSATLDALSVQKFVVTMSVEGRCYPVTTHYLTEACANYVATAVETVIRIHTSEEVPPYGADILVFLTGQEEIDAAVKLTKERITDYNRPSGGGPLVTFALHSGLPVGLQLEALKPVSRGSRKVVYSTNVAESGVTIPNVGYVVDTGFVKQALATVPNHHTLLVTPCSKEQLVQRAGRAGRVCPGICYRLFSKSSLGAFPDKTLPEITRTPSLSSVLLQIISLGVRNVCSLQWLTPPSARAMEAALEELRVLGFIDDKGIIADKRAAELLPLSPAQARLLLLSVDYGCSLEAVQLAALMSIDSIWARPHSRSTRERLAACKRSLGVHEGDMLTMINVYREWRENETSPDGDTDWAHRHMVHVGSMSRAAKIASVVRRQLCQVLIDSGMDAAKAQSKVDESCGDDIEPLCRCICGAFAANAASQAPVTGQQSVLYGVQRPPNYVVYSHGVDTGSNNGAYEMIHISQIDSQWLVDVAPTLYRPVKRK
ncbi:ATP-dependent RNA helicase, putative [Perkinsus marinus ATCC 50983]|uniref:ATP-dependent RNA helicase, putative n=1 Tax=Perkinsus marinus (strain ATCC 50983 / TXsc) TaxID=423536 RepID=C5M125_PERM5|nr:ATP-dependent RNA helicase, putative [Perkinsus marinus ATCC 50983]EEQ97255.1 ATP-dependent RNA helicase, putative [Perkinsus marinus ATCC 50983]|eukprot:XP_002764538.1 ATP-dependent RNA helicase, putative [Perkinsus marinus ATCC 50983]